jgi:hypothetical protein
MAKDFSEASFGYPSLVPGLIYHPDYPVTIRAKIRMPLSTAKIISPVRNSIFSIGRSLLSPEKDRNKAQVITRPITTKNASLMQILSRQDPTYLWRQIQSVVSALDGRNHRASAPARFDSSYFPL